MHISHSCYKKVPWWYNQPIGVSVSLSGHTGTLRCDPACIPPHLGKFCSPGYYISTSLAWSTPMSNLWICIHYLVALWTQFVYYFRVFDLQKNKIFMFNRVSACAANSRPPDQMFWMLWVDIHVANMAWYHNHAGR